MAHFVGLKDPGCLDPNVYLNGPCSARCKNGYSVDGYQRCIVHFKGNKILKTEPKRS